MICNTHTEIIYTYLIANCFLEKAYLSHFLEEIAYHPYNDNDHCRVKNAVFKARYHSNREKNQEEEIRGLYLIVESARFVGEGCFIKLESLGSDEGLKVLNSFVLIFLMQEPIRG